MFKNFFCIIFFYATHSLVLYGEVNGFTSSDYRLYKKAKKSYQKADYGACKILLESQLGPPFNQLTPYIWFYYALASYKQGSLSISTSYFHNIIARYPAWGQKDEVLYWLAQIDFEQGNYIRAFSYLKQIKDHRLDNSIYHLKKHFMHQTKDMNLLFMLQRLYPADLNIAEAWLFYQMRLPLICQDIEAIHELGRRFGCTAVLKDPLQNLHSIKKEVYHIAVFLPFFIDEIEYTPINTNLFVLDLYRGLQSAVEVLMQEGIQVILHPYDTKKSIPVTEALLAQPAMKLMDLIIGPLYPNTLPLVAAFAAENQINLFNPLSTNSNVVGHNPFVYLCKPSLETQARKAAYFMQENINLNDAKIGIVYGATIEDSLKAHLYKKYIEKLTPHPIKLMLELDENNAKQFLNRFRRSSLQLDAGGKDKKKILDGLTHVYIASQDELIVANMLSTLQIRKISPVILADEGCIKKDLLTIDQLQQHTLFFIAPDYVDYAQPDLYHFRNTFYDQFGIYPSYYAAIGYDMMLFIGKMLFQYGNHFLKYRNNLLFPGKVFSGFLYGWHHDNQQVPIIQFKDSKFVVCNSLSP